MDFPLITDFDQLQPNDIVLTDGSVCVVEEGEGLDDQMGLLFRPVDPRFIGQGTFITDPDEFEGCWNEVYLIERCG